MSWCLLRNTPTVSACHSPSEDTSSRNVRISGGFAFFKFGLKIVRVNLDTFEEVVLDKLADNIADFLVDENQTITYLTSQGELRQENPDNSSIPKTCVNLKTDSTTGGAWSTMLGFKGMFIISHYSNQSPRTNTLHLVGPDRATNPRGLVLLDICPIELKSLFPPEQRKLLLQTSSKDLQDDWCRGERSCLHSRSCLSGADGASSNQQKQTCESRHP